MDVRNNLNPLAVKGFAQKEGIDFDEIFSPVVKMTSIRNVLSIVATEDLHLEQLDESLPSWRFG